MKWLISLLMTVIMTIGGWLGLPCQVRGPERMTDAQAKVLAADLAKRGEEVLYVFWGAQLEGEYIGPLEWGDLYRIVENPFGIYTIADLKAFAEKTYTKAQAQEWFYGTDPDYCGWYYEKDGELYYEMHGCSPGEAPDTEKVKVQSQTEDTLIIKMKHSEGKGYTTWQLKWEDGAWKFDCNLWGNRFNI